MAYNRPAFDFEQYNPQDPWNFPGERLIIFGMDGMEIVKPYRARIVRRYRYPDLRFSFFNEWVGFFNTTMNFGMWQRGEAAQDAWWHQQPEFQKQFATNTIRNFNAGLRGLMQGGMVSGMVASLENTFFQIAETLGLDVENQYPETGVLAELEMYERIPLVKLWRIYEEVMQHNGRYCPRDRQDLTLRYGDKMFTFLNNYEVRVDDWGYVDEWEYLLYLTKETMAMVEAIFNDPALVEHSHILIRRQEERREEL